MDLDNFAHRVLDLSDSIKDDKERANYLKDAFEHITDVIYHEEDHPEGFGSFFKTHVETR